VKLFGNKITFKSHSVLPGFGFTLGFTLIYLTLIVLIPLSGLFFATVKISLSEFIANITSNRVIAAYKVSFGIAAISASISCFFGLVVAWVLVRYNFYGKKIIDAFVDLPFAIPTAVAGIALCAIYSPNGLIGKYLADFGIHIAFTPAGIAVALIFIGFPFVVRTVEPVLQDLDHEIEEAAASLGANRLQIFTKIIFPTISPALLTGFAMSFARGLGEYGSVIFIAGNIPLVSEIVPLIIITKLEQYDYSGATSIALLMLIISFFMLLIINFLQKWSNKSR
jgi:sulfate transport system permease protein